MKIQKRLPNGSMAIECAFCSGTGTFPEFATMAEDFNETCPVCKGAGVSIETASQESLVDCARCSGEGKAYDGAYFVGNSCEVCKGKGYINLLEYDYPQLWQFLHPRIGKTTRQLFEDGNYTEASFRAINSLNSELKDYYREKKGEELDGHALAGRILSVDDPILKISDLTTETGKNQQKGLIQLMQGLFVGIRNPISHGQTIGPQYCVHILFLISLIHYQLDYSELRARS